MLNKFTMNFKSKVTELWQEAGTPDWDYEQTLTACIKASNLFEAIHENPAIKFREELNNQNTTYIKQWVMGCHFEWLNPR